MKKGWDCGLGMQIHGRCMQMHRDSMDAVIEGETVFSISICCWQHISCHAYVLNQDTSSFIYSLGIFIK